MTVSAFDSLDALSAFDGFGGLLSKVLAHVGGLSDAASTGGVPSWLTVVTGGVLVGASFLFNSLLTDHEGIRAVNGWRAVAPTPETVRRGVAWVVRLVGVAVLALVVLSGFLAPSKPETNFAILVVWAGWWAGYAMSTYLLGNTWPTVNPWRTLATLLPSEGMRSYPERYGAWPSVVGLLALVWIEVVSPLAADARLLAGLVLAYTVVTLAGAILYGEQRWFHSVDPVSRVFRVYGRVAPIQRTADGFEFCLPGAALTSPQSESREPGSVAFVIALLWVTTFDGLVTTGAWNTFVEAVVAVGVPPLVVYVVCLLAGFTFFLVIYRIAARRARERVGSFLTPETIRQWFVPSLIPIAAGYHVAHFLGYFLSLAPAVVNVLPYPLGGAPAPPVLVVPRWFGTLQLGFVVLGHLLAVWVAHALAMELFPGILRPIRSQYPFVVVMMVYTMTSAWVVGQPFVSPAFVG
jgi:hypothetical protein